MGLKGKKLEEAIAGNTKIVNLEHELGKVVSHFSGGMKGSFLTQNLLTIN